MARSAATWNGKLTHGKMAPGACTVKGTHAGKVTLEGTVQDPNGKNRPVSIVVHPGELESVIELFQQAKQHRDSEAAWRAGRKAEKPKAKTPKQKTGIDVLKEMLTLPVMNKGRKGHLRRTTVNPDGEVMLCLDGCGIATKNINGYAYGHAGNRVKA